MSVDLQKVQKLIGEWAQRNFGSNYSTSRGIHLNSLAPLMGIGEEYGELLHAVLKEAQGIRGYQSRELYEEDRDDAVADLVIFLLDFCHREGVDFDSVLEKTTNKVLQRDWASTREVPQAPGVPVPVPSASSHPNRGPEVGQEPIQPPPTVDGKPFPTLHEGDRPQPLPGSPDDPLDERVETILEEMEDPTPPECEG